MKEYYLHPLRSNPFDSFKSQTEFTVGSQRTQVPKISARQFTELHDHLIEKFDPPIQYTRMRESHSCLTPHAASTTSDFGEEGSIPMSSLFPLSPSQPWKCDSVITTQNTREPQQPNADMSATTSHSHHQRPSDIRNNNRIIAAHQENQRLSGTYLSIRPIREEIADYIPDTIIFHDDLPRPNLKRLHMIKYLLSAKPTPIRRPPFLFEMTSNAAEHNRLILRQFGFNLDTYLRQCSNSTISPGSEFRPPNQLRFIFGEHKLWPFIEATLTRGAHIHLTREPADEQRRQENEALIVFNNHKKARENKETIGKSIKKDVELGFCTAIPIDCVAAIPKAMICPLGIVEQQTLAATGERKTKLRLTHDQSFSTLHNSESLNDLTDQDQFPELIYGFTLLRIIYHAVSLRWHFPTAFILCCKYDFSSAYRRIHYDGDSAARCIAVHDGLAYIWWRLSFGGSGCPYSWCPFGEIITDLANDLLQNPLWTPDLYGPSDPLPPLDPIRLPESVRIEPALPTLLRGPPRPEGFADVYVDDTMTVFLDTPQNLKRAPHAIPTATAVAARPSHHNEPLPREHLLSTDKYHAEGAPSEVKVILGWKLNFRTLMIHLPSDKHATWVKDITQLIAAKYSTKKELEQLIGRLNHTCLIIPLARYFLGPLRHLHSLGKHDNCRLKFNKATLHLLQHWISLIDHAHEGISFNLITMRRPTNVTITDACPAGLGGYSVKTGRAWRIAITQPHDISNNILEFLAAVVGIVSESEEGQIPRFGQILALTDNSSAVGWLQHANSNPQTSPKLYEIAIKLAEECRLSSFSIHPLHIPGKSNCIADALSRLHHLNDEELTLFIHKNFQSQIPNNFRICQLPRNASSWTSSILATPRGSDTGRQRTHTRNVTGLGDDGTHSSPTSTCTTTPSSTDYNTNNGSTSASLSFKPSDQAISDQGRTSDFRQQTKESFASELYKLPLASWLRNSGAMDDPARFTTKTTPTGNIQGSTTSSEPGTNSTPQQRKKLP